MKRPIRIVLEASTISVTLLCGACGESESSGTAGADGTPEVEGTSEAEAAASDSDAGLAECGADAGCPVGQTCYYLLSDGCDASGTCVENGPDSTVDAACGFSCSCATHTIVGLMSCHLALEPVTGEYWSTPPDAAGDACPEVDDGG